MSYKIDEHTRSFPFKPFRGGEAINKYVTHYRRSGLPLLEASAPLDLFPENPTSIDFIPQFSWEHPWPFNDRAGVYLVYSATCDLLYVGKAQCLGARLSQHFGSGKICVIRERWSQPPRFVVNVAVPTDMPFEAPALEGFLIGGLQPPDNIYGK